MCAPGCCMKHLNILVIASGSWFDNVIAFLERVGHHVRVMQDSDVLLNGVVMDYDLIVVSKECDPDLSVLKRFRERHDLYRIPVIIADVGDSEVASIMSGANAFVDCRHSTPTYVGHVVNSLGVGTS